VPLAVAIACSLQAAIKQQGRHAVTLTPLYYLLYLWPANGQQPFRKLEKCFQALSIKMKTTCCILRRGRSQLVPVPEMTLEFLVLTAPTSPPLSLLLAEAGLPGLASKPMCVRTLVTL
jgi:hypothetical protein